MNYALVRNSDGLVIGAANYATALLGGWRIPIGHSVRTLGANRIGAAYEAPAELTLSEAKQEKVFAAHYEHDARLAAGYAFIDNGAPKVASLEFNRIQVIMGIYALVIGTVLTQAGLMAAQGLPNIAMPPGDAVPFETGDGTFATLDRAEAVTLAHGVLIRLVQLRGRRNQLLASALSAVDQAALDLVDTTTGWP